MTRTTQTWKAFYFWGRGKRTELTKTEGNALQGGLKNWQAHLCSHISRGREHELDA